MRQLQDILYGAPIVKVHGSTFQEVNCLVVDSREVSTHDVFVAISGYAQDGHQYIDAAIEKGASVIVCENMPDVLLSTVSYIQVEDSRVAVATMAANFYNHPSKELTLVGITGTNGKTTVATLGYQLYKELGVKVGLVSTVENRIGDQVLQTIHTTPDAIRLQELLRSMVDAGCDIVFMEVSSHAIHQNRVKDVEFAAGVFTNISRDHLDYHHTFKDYILAKKAFFDHLPKTAFALVNSDDKNGEVMVQNTKARKLSYGMQTMAEYRVKVLENTLDGLLLSINQKDFYTQLAGEYNAMNLLAVYAIAIELGEDELNVLQILSNIKGAKGRLEKLISPTNIVAIVDYAHTPDALQKSLETLHESRKGVEQLYTVVGCGGNRDKGKRPQMAKVAVKYSNKVILTSDNPRDENPVQIIEEMAIGVPISKQHKILKITNRADAIRTAISMAEPGDVIYVAGKGHETYQEIMGERFPFDDKEVLQQAFKEFDK